MKKKILIYGITGQDGSYLAENYLEKKFIVHGISRKKSGWDRNLKKLGILNKLKIFKLDKKYKNLNKILLNNYTYIFFLGGQSSVIASYKKLEQETYDSQILPLQTILENLRTKKICKTKLMFSSSSEIFGYHKKKKLNEESLKKPLSPYALSKLIGYEIVKSYREMFDLDVFTIIFFNHESALRSDDFIFKKLLNYIKTKNFSKKLELGNIDVIRDWGSSEEYMKIIIKIMENKKIEDYILATGFSIKLRKIIEYFFKKKNLDYKKYIKINKKFFRAHEIKENYANIDKIKKIIKAYPKIRHEDLIDQFYKYEI